MAAQRPLVLVEGVARQMADGETLPAAQLPAHGHASTDLSDATPAGRALLTAADAAAQRTSLGLGTAATVDTGIGPNNVLKTDANGNLGVGVAPHTWLSTNTGVELGGGGAYLYGSNYGSIMLGQNAVYGADATWRSLSAGYSTNFSCLSGGFYFYSANSASASDPLTWTKALVVKNTGAVLVGTDVDNGSGAKLQVNGGATCSGNLGIGGGGNSHKVHIAGGGQIYHQGVAYASLTGRETNTGGNAYQLSSASSSEGLELAINQVSGSGLRITSSGHSLFGTTADNGSGAKLQVFGNYTPSADNAYSLGVPSYRLSVVYAASGSINTSDEREKTDISQLSAAEIAASKDLAAEIGTYQFLVSVAEKGVDAARLHIGLTVQRAIEIMQRHGLDPLRYAFICYDAWDTVTVDHQPVEAREAVIAEDGAVLDAEIQAQEAWTETVREAGDRYSFRPDELALFLAKGFDARLRALESV